MNVIRKKSKCSEITDSTNQSLIRMQKAIPIIKIEVRMNKIIFVIDVVDKVIAVAGLIRDTAELRKKEIKEDDSEKGIEES